MAFPPDDLQALASAALRVAKPAIKPHIIRVSAKRRRLLRRLAVVAWSVSALLLSIFVAIAIIERHHLHYLGYDGPISWRAVMARPGGFVIARGVFDRPNTKTGWNFRSRNASDSVLTTWVQSDSNFLGFQSGRYRTLEHAAAVYPDETIASEAGYFTLPYWPFIGATAILPAGAAVYLCKALLHRARRKPGFCRKCNYDLRSSINRCPECGTPFTNTAAPRATNVIPTSMR
jgi:hypothetical protein